MTRAEMQVAHRAPAPAASPFRRKDNEVQRVRLLDLQPRAAPAARRIEAIERLGHHPFVTGGESLPRERGRIVRIRSDKARNDVGGGQVTSENRRPERERFVDQRIAIEIQGIEEEGCERQLLAETRDVEFPPEPPHGDLEGMRAAAGPNRDDFTVENELARRN